MPNFQPDGNTVYLAKISRKKHMVALLYTPQPGKMTPRWFSSVVELGRTHTEYTVKALVGNTREVLWATKHNIDEIPVVSSHMLWDIFVSMLSDHRDIQIKAITRAVENWDKGELGEVDALHTLMEILDITPQETLSIDS